MYYSRFLLNAQKKTLDTFYQLVRETSCGNLLFKVTQFKSVHFQC